ncbi:hypothetical protein B0J13DRAFT_535395 [Dactylonectria estremocensis]|uniref:Secreted protein n=1 Tax=Dactylonectria estremocensis TaxID=1079267 RepID=A0A9P9JD87_9HYPO|nr:hypothetical protein B0J13DRAFT_535395 [Dactylonectria estremocensis]
MSLPWTLSLLYLCRCISLSRNTIQAKPTLSRLHSFIYSPLNAANPSHLGANPQCLMRKGHGPCPLYARQHLRPVSIHVTQTCPRAKYDPEIAHGGLEHSNPKGYGRMKRRH